MKRPLTLALGYVVVAVVFFCAGAAAGGLTNPLAALSAERASGTVLKAEGTSVTVDIGNGSSKTFSVGNGTLVLSAPVSRSVSDLKPGTPVTVTASGGSARLIQILSAPAAK